MNQTTPNLNIPSKPTKQNIMMQRRNSLSPAISPLSTPVSSPPGSPSGICRPRRLSISEPMSSNSGHRMEKLMEAGNATVLVIGKEPNTAPASTISALLELVGYKVETVADMKDALKCLTHGHTYIGIMCYVSQQGKDVGLAILKELKQSKEGQHLPVVMIGHKEAIDVTSKCFRMGAADVISPPLTAEFLKARLGSTFKHYWMAKEMTSVISTADNTKHELIELKEELTSIKSKYMDAVHENECLKASNQTLMQENNKYSTELKTSQNEQKRLTQEIQMLSAETIVKDSSEDSIRQDNRKLKQRVSELDGIVKGKEIIISELLKKTQTLTSKQQRIAELEQVVAKLEKRNETLIKKFKTKVTSGKVDIMEPEEKKLAGITAEEFEKEIASREDIITKLQIEFQSENDKLEETIQSLQAKLEEQKKITSTKDEEVKVLSQQVQSLAWRVALLTNEKTSKEVVAVPLTAEEQDILKKAKHSKEQFESPIEAIVCNIQSLHDFVNSHNLPEEVNSCVKALSRAIAQPSSIFKPCVESVIESLPLDATSKQWIQTTFTGEPLQLPRNPLSDKKCLANTSDTLSRVCVDSNLLKDWLFDSFIRSEDDLVLYAVHMFKDLGLLTHFIISESTMIRFVESVKDSHNNNPFHNWRQSFEIAHVSYLFLIHTRASTMLTPLSMFTLLLACLCKNLGHPGLNNLYQVNAKTPLANMYQDINVLENHAITMAFKLFTRSDSNIFGELTAEQFKEFRKSFIKVIRASDTSCHLELNSLLNVQHMVKGFSKEDPANQTLLMSSILHAADLSIVTMPIHSREWVEMAYRENTNQGEKEKEMNLPISPFCNRADTNIVRFAVNFIDYLAHPFYVTLQKVLPELDVCFGWMKQNRTYWSKMDALEPTLPEVTESALGVLLARKRPTSAVDKWIKQKPAAIVVEEDSGIPQPAAAFVETSNGTDPLPKSPKSPLVNRVISIPKMKHSLSVPDLLPRKSPPPQKKELARSSV